MKLLSPLVLLACVALGLTINWVMGKDMNADMLAYHVYSAHMLWTDGYRDDFLGAGLQSFFNPLGYLPFYWMLQAGWSSLAIASVMAVFHSLNLFMVWMIGKDFLFVGSANRHLLAGLGVLLAAVSPVFIAILGSSFLDPIQSVLLLGGLFCLMRAVQQSGAKYIGVTDLLIGGLLLGAATGLKPTVITTPIASLVGLMIVSWRLASARIALHRCMLLGMSIAAGGLLTGGFWAFHLWQRYGSPVFPFANNVFKSPDFFTVPLTTDRFIADGALEFFAFPFRMAKINSGIYVEIAAPELRFALLLIALVCWLFLAYRARQKSVQPSAPGQVSPAVLLLWIVFVLAVTVWMTKLGNGRYHVLYLLLAGPLLQWVLWRIWGERNLTLLAGCLILVAQFSHALSMGYPRWESGSWTDSWVRTEWPAGLPRSPATWVQVGPGIETMVFANFPAGGKFVDLGGKFPVSPDSPLASKTRQLLADHSRPRFVLFKSRASPERELHAPRELSEEARLQLNHLLAPWNLSLASRACVPIEVELDRDEIGFWGQPRILLAARRYALLACPLQAGGSEDKADMATRMLMQQAALSLMQSCPVLFPAPASLPTRSAHVWTVRFVGTDTVLALNEGNLSYSRYPFGPFNVPVELNLENGRAFTPCTPPRRNW